MTTTRSPRDEKQHIWLALAGQGSHRVCTDCSVREGTPAAQKPCVPPAPMPRGVRSDYDPFANT